MTQKSKTIVHGILIAALVSGCMVSTPRGLYKRSVEAIAQGKYEQAISGLTKAIESDPKFTEAYVNRGIAYSESGNVKDAIADYQAAIKLNPELLDAYYNLGNAYMQEQSYEKAIASYSQVLKRDANHAYALGNRGNAYELIGDTPNALSDIETAAQIFENQGEDQAAAIARQKLETLK